MKILTALGTVLVLGSAPLAGAQSTAGPAAVPQAPAAAPTAALDRAAMDRAIAAVYPSLVRIFVVVADAAGGREIKREGAGSGTIITPDGYIVTNHHVAGRAERIECTLSDKEEMPADLIGTDPLSDIAVLKLHPAEPRKFPAAVFGDSSRLRSGDPVLAMGSPLALSQSVTRGIVSNAEMIMPQVFGDAGMGLLDGENVGTIVRWIGHDAAIYPGNSGGPLVNLSGQIIGINEISYGLAGAIPANLAKSVVEALIKSGHVRRSWTGMDVQPRLTNESGPGALVSWVADRSPAASAGVRAGDILVKVNGASVDVRFAEELPPVNQLLFALPIDKPSRLVVRRDGRDMDVTVTPVERPAAASTSSEQRAWGFAASNLTAFEAREMGRDSIEGVRVVSLRPGGPSAQAKPPLERDDVIVAIEGEAVRSVADFETRTKTLLGSKSHASALVAFDRGLERRLTVVDVSLPAPPESIPEASKPWVPISVQSLTPPIADRLGLKGRTGVRVTRVMDDACPLKVGDVILAIDNDPIRASAPNDDELFATAIRRYRVNATITLSVVRDQQALMVPVVLGAAPPQARDMKPYDDATFEFRARNLVATDRNDPRLSGALQGVMVESVSDGGWAALARLLVGDIIVAIDGHNVSSVDDLEGQMKDIVARRPGAVALEVRRGIRTLFLEMDPTWK